jgi:2-iminobutanoate/2-iminopropanoate deaminase
MAAIDTGKGAAIVIAHEVYGGYFQATPPARATVQVAALPRGARVEIDCVAMLPG